MDTTIKSYTHVAIVLDASGSMGSLRESTIKTLKDFFASIKSPEDRTIIDLWQFDDNVKHLINGVDIEQGAGQAIEQYAIGGCTALYDAICTGIDELGAKLAAMPEEDRPDSVVFAILTDGFENASRQFSVQDVKSRIVHQSEKYAWQFRFLAANQDAVCTGRDMGLAADVCMNFEASVAGNAKWCKGLSHFCGCDNRISARAVRKARMQKHA